MSILRKHLTVPIELKSLLQEFHDTIPSIEQQNQLGYGEHLRAQELFLKNNSEHFLNNE